MKLMQLNVWGGRLGKQIQNLIAQDKPDVICLQEAVSIKGGSNGGWFLTVDEIEHLYGMDLAFSPVINFSFMRRKAEFGNAIFTKDKILDKKLFLLVWNIIKILILKETITISETYYMQLLIKMVGNFIY